MNDAVLVALITLGGSGMGSLCGIIISSRLTAYRLEQLEKKVQAHNSLIERTYKLEERTSLAERDIEELKERVS